MTETQFAEQVKKGEKFEFGKNWSAFLSTLDDERIETACQTLKSQLSYDDPANIRFIDAGSGSGLFSLAARKLGFQVFSFDFDTQSVECTQSLKQRYYPNDTRWEVREASVLDKDFIKSLGQFDIVYSWGVLHHTGDMWSALENVSGLVKPGGQLFIAIYNDEGFQSRVWHKIKKFYCSGLLGKYAMIALFVPLYFFAYLIMDILKLRNPFTRYKLYKAKRGMSMYYDWIDWIGGYPFEVATTEQLFNFYKERGYQLEHLTTTNRSGCNELVFRKVR